jgi:hypothetical protein
MAQTPSELFGEEFKEEFRIKKSKPEVDWDISRIESEVIPLVFVFF